MYTYIQSKCCSTHTHTHAHRVDGVYIRRTCNAYTIKTILLEHYLHTPKINKRKIKIHPDRKMFRNNVVVVSVVVAIEVACFFETKAFDRRLLQIVTHTHTHFLLDTFSERGHRSKCYKTIKNAATHQLSRLCQFYSVYLSESMMMMMMMATIKTNSTNKFTFCSVIPKRNKFDENTVCDWWPYYSCRCRCCFHLLFWYLFIETLLRMHIISMSVNVMTATTEPTPTSITPTPCALVLFIFLNNRNNKYAEKQKSDDDVVDQKNEKKQKEIFERSVFEMCI